MRLPALPFAIFMIAVVLVAHGGAVKAAPSETPRIDIAQLNKTAATTAERMRTRPAAWTVDNSLGSGAVISVSVLRAGSKGRMIFNLQADGKRTEMLRIIFRDGLWYCTDRRGSFKHRPYELPTDTPFIYMCMLRCEPIFILREEQLGEAKFESVKDGVATFRQPIPEDLARMIQGMAGNLKELQIQSGRPLNPELTKQLEQLKDLAARGISMRVDLSTGQICEFGAPKLRTSIVDFHFRSKVDDAEFAIADNQWQDYSDDPTAGNLDDLLMIGHYPPGLPGMKQYDLDGRLMDVKTGRFRRIPFEGGVMLPGCFLSDRRHVIVCGTDGESPGVRPFEVDLKTGGNRMLGDARFKQGFIAAADLSPNGKTLVVAHFDPSAGQILNGQVCLIDVKTGDAKPLGKPRDAAFLNWTADGQHIVLIDRKYKDMSMPAVAFLAVMDMNGEVKILRPGNDAMLLADRKTILFKNTDDRLWHTCDLAGQNDHVFAGGLKGYGFPAPAPDGKRILMMHFGEGALPKPEVLTIGETQGRVITSMPGLWGVPAWR